MAMTYKELQEEIDELKTRVEKIEETLLHMFENQAKINDAHLGLLRKVVMAYGADESKDSTQ